MAQSTTVVNACDASVWLDDALGTPTNISGSSNVVNMDFDQELGEFRTFQSKWKGRLECGKDAAFEIILLYSTTANEAYDILKTWFFAASPGDRSLSVYLPDKNVGSDHYSAEVKLDDFNVPSNHEDPGPITVTMHLLPNGEVSHDTAAT